MDALIRIQALEFDETLFRKIGEIFKDRNAEITISIKDVKGPVANDRSDAEYWNKIDQSISELEAGGGKIFTMQEFKNFVYSE